MIKMKRIVVLLSILLMLFIVGCSANSTSVTSANEVPTTTTYPDDSIPDDYITDAVMDDGEYPFRVYKDQLVLHKNGKEYIAAGNYNGTKFMDLGEVNDSVVQYSDEEIKDLKVGDEFIYDRDIRFTIESLDAEDWEYKYSNPQHPDFPAGIIRLNGDYVLRHGQYYYDVNLNLASDEDYKKWELVSTEDIDKSANVISTVDSVKLLEYSENCRFSILVPGETDIRYIKKEQLSTVFDLYVSSGRSFCYSYITVRNNKVVSVFLKLDSF